MQEEIIQDQKIQFHEKTHFLLVLLVVCLFQGYHALQELLTVVIACAVFQASLNTKRLGQVRLSAVGRTEDADIQPFPYKVQRGKR